tara:strand:- start:23718 stop:24128 length:411 start_codon:yes stop_codon:yes gene_type:complete
MIDSTNFILAPIVGFICAGTLKFFINSIKLKRLAFSEIGLGNFPSTHNCIVSTTFFTILLTEGLYSPLTALSLSLCFIVTIDSLDLRKKIETHAVLLREISNKTDILRTKVGHTIPEVAGGYFLGFVLALMIIYLG